ncbi:MAG: sugar ABC transporter permease [Chloroflexi bacterium]|nr:MAG: sugar ABC transporter permease [Chloroflexota bacterium]
MASRETRSGLKKLTPDSHQHRSRARTKSRANGLSNWIFLVPMMFFFIGYQVYPILRVLWMSFTNYRFLRLTPAEWVGFDNYRNALVDPIVYTGLLRAAEFTVLFLPGTILLPMLLAVLIERVEHERLASLYRIILLIPAVIPGTLIFTLWKWMYDFHIGPINYILIQLGWFTERTAPQWLGGTALTLPAVAAFEVWWGLGYHTMFFLAGLASIPKDLTDAARIDGANEWKLFWYVTMPRLLPVLSILVVLRFGSAMSVIEEYLIFGGYNRASPTYTWTVYMYDLAFKIGDWLQGYAAAIGWIGASAMMCVVGGMLYLFRSRD